MVKNFYRRIAEPKTFFAPSVKVRSLAFGENTREELINWQNYFMRERGVGGGRLIISSDEGIYGSEYARGGAKDGKAAPKGAGGVCSLLLGGVKYELGVDGWVMADGKKTDLYAGVEIKAWAIATVPTQRDTKNMLFIISKPKDGGHMMLSGYEISRGRPSGVHTFRVEYESTFENESYITCYGSNIFTVHNSALDYYYWNVADGTLERVPIGRDGDNSDFPPCHRVQRGVVSNRVGNVFWLSDGEIYGIEIGRPTTLKRVVLGADEETVSIRGDERGLTVYRRNKNTEKLTLARYAEEGGEFRIYSIDNAR